jgi:predicted metal-dependent phosphoesterase TrpH
MDFLSDIPRFRALAKEHSELLVNAHNHTRLSDGETNILVLIFLNWLCGIREVWITDHNAVWDARRPANRFLVSVCKLLLGIKLVSGAELSCKRDLSRYGGSENTVMHIVVGNFKRFPEGLRRRLVTCQIKRDERMEDILTALRRQRFKTPSYGELVREYGNVTLKIIAKNVCDENGSRINAEYIEKNFLSDGAQTYIPNNYLLSVSEAVALSKTAGVDIIWPHPKHTLKGPIFEKYFEEVALSLKKEGIGKIEARTKRQGKKDMHRIERFCFWNHMETSGGADMHFINDMRVYIHNMLEAYA